MTDPLSVAAGTAGFISLGIQVTQSLIDFYTAYKNQHSALADILEKLEALLDIFKILDQTLRDRKFDARERPLISRINSLVSKCQVAITELDEQCKKFVQTPTKLLERIKAAGNRVAYPFRKGTLDNLDEDISDIRENLSLALQVLQLQSHKQTQDESADIKSLVELVRAHQISSTLRDWLKPPDVSINHNIACAKKHPGSGTWLTNGPAFQNWLTKRNSFIWLNGFAGCGKSVLCSTAIQYVFRRTSPGVGIAFFYFTFNDESKQDAHSMVRALLFQIMGQLGKPDDLDRLRDSYKSSTPPLPVLLEHLHSLLDNFDDVYILLDALDESPKPGRRDQVLEMIDTIRNWNVRGLHLLVTSRDENDIRDALQPSPDEDVLMKNPGIDKDIKDYISAQLGNRKFRKWQAFRDDIQKSFAERAKGVFRWVECQFTALQSCPCSKTHLGRLLKSLPQTLDETYERMLCGIEPMLIEDARRLLTMLCFATRPMTVPEVIDGLAVELGESPRLNKDSRVQGADDLRELCPGFIEIGGQENQINYDSEQEAEETDDDYEEDQDGGSEDDKEDSEEDQDEDKEEIYFYDKDDDDEDEDDTDEDGEDDDDEDVLTVRLAHFSVQEYLKSPRIFNQKSAMFGLDSDSANAEMTQVFLTYLADPGLSDDSDESSLYHEYPLMEFAANQWTAHYRQAGHKALVVDSFVLNLFKSDANFKRWATVIDGQEYISPPISYAAFLGFPRIVSSLVEHPEDYEYSATKTPVEIINAPIGLWGHPLQAAAAGGHYESSMFVIDGVDEVNSSGREYDHALHLVSLERHFEVIKYLVDKGADVNAQGGCFGNALQAALTKSRLEVAKYLRDREADVNTLKAISKLSPLEIAKFLVDMGADVNAPGGFLGNAIQAASWSGYLEAVQWLVDRGADINVQGGLFGNALQAASFTARFKVVKWLVDKGADVNAQGGVFGSALQAVCGAAAGGSRPAERERGTVVRLLLDKEANVNFRGGWYGTALRAARNNGYSEISEMLLAGGAIDHVGEDEDEDGSVFDHKAMRVVVKAHFDTIEHGSSR